MQILFSNLAIFVLALLVGVEVIGKIPSTLHTPMMSGANAIHGVVIVGAIVTASLANSPAGYILTFIAGTFAAANVLKMFTKRKPAPTPVTPEDAS
jgi:NAD(P) transhydrogenase subunit alpha